MATATLTYVPIEVVDTANIKEKEWLVCLCILKQFLKIHPPAAPSVVFQANGGIWI